MAVTIAAAMASICVSCSRELPVQQAARGPSNFGIEDARAALIELVESSDNSVLRMSLDFLRTAPAEKQADGWVEIGAWRLDLREKTFRVTATGQDAMEDYGGKFYRDDQGAQITESRQT